MKRQRQFSIEEFEDQWICPITHMPMKDPVILEDGHSYQKKDIIEWLKKEKKSPATNLLLKRKEIIIPNIALRNVIQKFNTQIKYDIEKLKIQNSQYSSQIQAFQQKHTQPEKLKQQPHKIKDQSINLQKDSNLRQQYSKLLKQYNDLKAKDQIINAVQIQKTRQKRLKGLQKDHNLLHQKCERMNIQIENQNRSLQQFRKMQKQFRQLQIINSRLASELQKPNLKLQKSKIELENLMSQLQRSKNQYHNLKKAYDLLKSQTDQKKRQQELKKHFNPVFMLKEQKINENPLLIELNKANQTIKQLREENQQLVSSMKEKDQPTKKIAQLIKIVQAKKSQINRITSQKIKLTRIIEEFKQEKLKIQQSNKNYQQEIFKIADMKADVERQKIKNAKIQKQKNQQTMLIYKQHYQLLNSDLKAKINDLIKQLKKVELQKLQLRNRLENTQKQLYQSVNVQLNKKDKIIRMLNEKLQIKNNTQIKSSNEVHQNLIKMNDKDKDKKTHQCDLSSLPKNNQHKQMQHINSTTCESSKINSTAKQVPGINYEPLKKAQESMQQKNVCRRLQFTSVPFLVQKQKKSIEIPTKKTIFQHPPNVVPLISSQIMSQEFYQQQKVEKGSEKQQQLSNQQSNLQSKIQQQFIKHQQSMGEKIQPSISIPKQFSLIKKSQNLKSPQTKSIDRKNILPFQDYLIRNPALYDETKLELNHSSQKVNMKDFLSHNWEMLKIIHFSNCKLSNEELQMFLRQASDFPNLVQIILWNNPITQLPSFTFERFTKLKNVFLPVKKGLTKKSLMDIIRFKNLNPQIYVNYEA